MENDIPQVADQALTMTVALKNAGIAALVAFGILYAIAYKKVGADEFVFWCWLTTNRNRWLNGIITLILFSSLALLVPDIARISNEIGFNLNAAVPLSFGIALAGWLQLTSKKEQPAPPAQGMDKFNGE